MFFPAFYAPHIIWVEFGPLCQLFLCQTAAFSLLLDSGSKDDAIIVRQRHSETQQQSFIAITTPLNG